MRDIRKNGERKKKQRYAWHVVSCVAEKETRKKRERLVLLFLYLFLVDNVTHALCHYRKTPMKAKTRHTRRKKIHMRNCKLNESCIYS